jgi:hypothetical protein
MSVHHTKEFLGFLTTLEQKSLKFLQSALLENNVFITKLYVLGGGENWVK